MSNTSAYKHIDSNFINSFSSKNFDYFGDYCSVRNSPIYSVPGHYPAFICLHPSKNSHFGFKGIEEDIKSYATTLLPNIINSDYWTNILNNQQKAQSYGCKIINDFSTLVPEKKKGNPIIHATTWKAISISHYLYIMDYKIKNNLIK